MRLRMVFIVALALLLASVIVSAQTATINYAAPEQTIRGFGGSTAWLGQLTTAQANALFSPSSGLGLSILRVRIDPTGSASANWVPTDGNWGQEVANAQAAVSANPNAIVFASPWTPPTSMKNSSVSQPYFSGTCSPSAGYCGGYLDPSNYAAYATYLEDFVTYFNAHSAFDLYAISMQNEPDYANVNYESCNWTAAQMDTWVAGNASVLTTKLIMPESFQFIQTQSNTALNDSNAESLISIIGGHIYGVSPAPYPLAVQDGKDLWMTEHALTPSGSQPTITDALAAAEEVHNSMVTGSYNAYVWWWIWDDPSDGVNYGLINSSTTSPAPTYYGYALGQFARFIQPGYVMVNATDPVPGVFDSAYMGDGNLVIVAINSNTAATSFPVTIQGQAVTSFTPYQTSATETMTQLTPVTVTGGAFTYSLPAQSITTFVTAASTTPGFTISPSVPSLSITQGKTATDTITVTNLNGFSGSVTLAASGLPTGVTAAFGTNPTTGASVLTLTTSSSAPTGSATVTVTGTSGTLTETATIALFVGSNMCNIVYTISPQSSSAFGGSITIDNTGTTALSNWTLAWAFANGQTISSLWNGVETQSGANVTVTNESYNGSIPAGGSLSQVGFNGTWNGVTNAVPTAFTLNGMTCSSNGAAPTGSFTLAPSASTLAVTQGSSATDTIAVTDVSGFTGSVTLATSGLPSGVTAAFGTNPTAGTSVLTLTASATATAGTSTVTITGTSGSVTATTTIALTLSPASSFTIAPSASTLTVVQGKTATDTITVTDVGGFTGSVTLAASGLPSGVTAAFGTNPTTGTSVLTLTASATATAGNSTVTITGTSGSVTATTTIALTVSPASSFTIAPSASTLTVIQGKTATDTITVTDVSGFTGSVTLAASGLPSGVTAAFGTNPTTGTSVLTLTASATATAGNSTVTITGTSGSVTAATTIALTVSPASSFTIAPSASTLTVVQGGNATDTITVTDVGGFTGSVTLAASGLPSGVTAVFGTNPTTGASVLTLTASATATTGNSTVTITGTSGSTTASTTIDLTVSSSGGGSACTVDYTISPQSASQFGAAVTIKNGGNATLSNWSLTWSFANGQAISSSWNGAVSQSGTNVTVSQQSGQTWESIPAGGSYSGFGFNGTWNGTTNAVPTAFSLNGTACTVN